MESGSSKREEAAIAVIPRQVQISGPKTGDRWQRACARPTCRSEDLLDPQAAEFHHSRESWPKAASAEAAKAYEGLSRCETLTR